jgi:3-dehydroquinate synthase
MLLCGKETILNTPGLFEKALQEINASSTFILLDENTRRHCLPRLEDNCPSLKLATKIEVPSGEKHKTIESCQHIWKRLAEGGADRKSLLINLGGGVITDMGGFAASTFKRGIRYFHIPTTLLAIVDAAIGGKCGVDLEGLKNQVGLFGKPEGIYVLPVFLETLPMRQLKSGYAEIVKIALTSSVSLWNSLQNVTPEKNTDWSGIIYTAISLKQAITEADPYEAGERKLLNFGHTYGHAVETFFLRNGKDILHGEAVALGMIFATKLSVTHSGLQSESAVAIETYIRNTFTLPVIESEDQNSIFDLMKHDKKNVGGKVKFTLLEAIGKGRIG